MKTTKVIVLPYSEAWKKEFENIRIELENALGSLSLAIEHVGSTSVDGMSAKPCIDIDAYIKYKTPCIEELYRQCGLLE